MIELQKINWMNYVEVTSKYMYIRLLVIHRNSEHPLRGRP